MAPTGNGTLHKLSDFVDRRDVGPDAKLGRIAHDVDALSALALAHASATSATADAVAAVAVAVADHTERLERIEAGVIEALALATRAESGAREAMASDLDLSETVERERVARELEAALVREMLAPIVAEVGRRAGNAGATKTAGALSLAAVVAGLAAKPSETLSLLREIGPTGAGIAVVLLLGVLAFGRFRRS